MPNRLEPIDLTDFSGGLNLRTNQFQLAENETPDLLNVDIDPRGGFYTRKGWMRWNDEGVVDVSSTPWEPRNMWVHEWANGTQKVYVANAGFLYSAGSDGVFTRVGTLVGDAHPHDFDAAAWGDDLYLACGMFHASVRRHLDTTLTTLSGSTWSEIETPTHNTMPACEYVTNHADYLFCAVTVEAGTNHFARVRWSHPSQPDCWRTDDYIDIEADGGRITGLMSFRDHLLIFKSNSLWALYGYDDNSWQLIKVSTAVGCPAPTAMSRSETAVYFFSATDRGGIYAYTGEAPLYLSDNLRTAFEEILNYDNVFVSWAERRLWVAVPWLKDLGSTVVPSTTFVFDPDVGNGAWTMYRSNYGCPSIVVEGPAVNFNCPLTAFWSTYVSTLVTLDRIDDAYDMVLEAFMLGYTPSGSGTDPIGFLTTGDDKEIELTGAELSGQAFDSYYRTRWLHAGWPDRKKSWRRPTFICRQVNQNTDLLVETFRDYNETTVHRTRTLRVRAEGNALWTPTGYSESEIGGFNWTEGGDDDPTGRGADWSAQRQGSNLLRAGSQGLARAVQMRVRASPSTPRQKWGIDGIVAKFVNRRFR